MALGRYTPSHMSRSQRFIRIETHDEDGTERLGEVIAETCPRPVFLALDGDLGSGKTRLARGLALKTFRSALSLTQPNEYQNPVQQENRCAVPH